MAYTCSSAPDTPSPAAVPLAANTGSTAPRPVGARPAVARLVKTFGIAFSVLLAACGGGASPGTSSAGGTTTTTGTAVTSGSGNGSTTTSAGTTATAGVTTGTGGSTATAADSTAATTTGSSTTGGCPAGAVQCPDRCSNLMIDPYNCGACGNACPSGQSCVAGSCGCAAGQTDCGTGCVSLDDNGQHCGTCNNACTDGLVCSGGACGSGCLPEFAVCDGGCKPIMSSVQHCGGCNMACRADQVCTNGVCGCSSSLLDCGGVCTDVTSNNQHCGACNSACQGAENCVDSFCLDPASLDCGGSPSAEICTNFEQQEAGKYYLFNNLWGADENNVQGSQCMWQNCLAGDLIGWGTSWQWPSTSGVKSYTSVVLGWHWGWVIDAAQTGLPVQVNSNSRITCGWSFDVNANGADVTVAYDLWTHTTQNPGNVDPSDEIMIWLYQQGAVGPIGTHQATANIAGVSWDLYRGQGGASWEVFSYVRSANTTTAVMDITAFTDDLVTRGWMESNKYLVSIEAGPEVSGGSGEVNTRGFYCRNQ